MKKILSVALILIAAVMLWSYSFQAGVRHAIEDSCIWTVERYDPDNPYENLRDDGTDQTIYIELDGELYEHGMYQG